MNICSKLILFLIITGLGTINSSAITKEEPKEKNADGPYLFYLPDGNKRIISVDTNGCIKDTIFASTNFILPVTSHSGKHKFEVQLHPITRQSCKSPKSKKLFVISDPHGNLDCFVSVLRSNNIIDESYNWIYGKNHLIILGDVFDRGKDVLPIFWLIYKLEKEAQDAGGQLSFLLGNHEPMVLAGDYRYMDKTYKELAEKLNIDYRDMFGPDTELGCWLATRNAMQIIGNDLFVHAGLSKAFLEKNLSVEQVNEELSRGLFMSKQERKELSPLTEFLYGSEGPIWYRGMVRNDEKYNPLHINDLQLILNRYKVKRIIVGHTIFPDIKTLYGRRVITVNVDNKKNFESVTGRGILIKNSKTFVISDKGILKELYL
ncbi:metallophosphoesterase [Bacteroides sp. 519]|uniref:metallophosphoesterase n=1 Tax=Bacteroides sp. 519 TaxID=2302937 RepID=UPI0013D7CED8|nr:metallophosphoesterase [Bacteroides sp. 519]NDV59594.1 metallophosphatase [Bacteroides sp. 519]